MTLQLSFFLDASFIEYIIGITIIDNLIKNLLIQWQIWGRKTAKLIDIKLSNSVEVTKKKIDNCKRQNINKKVVIKKSSNPVYN